MESAHACSAGKGFVKRNDGAVSLCDSMTAGGPVSGNITYVHAIRRTGMFMELDVEVGKEARGPDDDERWVGRVLPEQRRELFQGLRREVVRNDKGE